MEPSEEEKERSYKRISAELFKIWASMGMTEKEQDAASILQSQVMDYLATATGLLMMVEPTLRRPMVMSAVAFGLLKILKETGEELNWDLQADAPKAGR